MFRSIVIGQPYRLIPVAGNSDDPIVSPRDLGNLLRGQDGKLPVDLVERL
jgi:hypothetical protein